MSRRRRRLAEIILVGASATGSHERLELALLRRVLGYAAAVRRAPRSERSEEDDDVRDVFVRDVVERVEVEGVGPRFEFGPRRCDSKVEIGLLGFGLDDGVLGEGEADDAGEAVGVEGDEDDAALATGGVERDEGRAGHLCGDDDGEIGEEVGVGGDEVLGALVHERTGDGGVQLVEVGGDRLGLGLAEVGGVHEEVVAQIASLHERVVHERERGDAAQHEVLDRLRAGGAAVQKTHLALLETRLPARASEEGGEGMGIGQEVTGVVVEVGHPEIRDLAREK